MRRGKGVDLRSAFVLGVRGVSVGVFGWDWVRVVWGSGGAFGMRPAAEGYEVAGCLGAGGFVKGFYDFA